MNRIFLLKKRKTTLLGQKCKTLTSKTVTVGVQDSDTLADVKAKLERKTAIPVVFQRLLFEGSQSDDEVVLLQNRVRKQSTLHMAARLRGGVQSLAELEAVVAMANRK